MSKIGPLHLGTFRAARVRFAGFSCDPEGFAGFSVTWEGFRRVFAAATSDLADTHNGSHRPLVPGNVPVTTIPQPRSTTSAVQPHTRTNGAPLARAHATKDTHADATTRADSFATPRTQPTRAANSRRPHATSLVGRAQGNSSKRRTHWRASARKPQMAVHTVRRASNRFARATRFRCLRVRCINAPPHNKPPNAPSRSRTQAHRTRILRTSAARDVAAACWADVGSPHTGSVNTTISATHNAGRTQTPLETNATLADKAGRAQNLASGNCGILAPQNTSPADQRVPTHTHT